MSHGFMGLAFMSEEWYVAYPIVIGYIAASSSLFLQYAV